ncbi:DUF5004 domain-containing protein [Salegentibacter flavus]|uniref:Lipocalin-like domain-containing protein n=1 Tax=Salegentibacter flavus TaxID=287099 RepID=A0A1I5APU0_9FLAO|nr:lipocalin family protein [Salegentibacter flavus]SFN64458.1 Lipocalin-like domain-containing protein [Salegentibacter flavus]
MNNLMKYRNLVLSILFVVLFTACEADSVEANSENLQVTNLTITKSELEGEWELSGMIAEEPVDLNNDGVASRNLLDEASCFDRMNAVFNADGSFSSINGRLDFNSGENGDSFTCGIDRQDFGAWDLKDDNILMLTMTINGQDYLHEKDLEVDGNTFSFKITKFESDEYVNDPGDSQASHVSILSLEYARVN